MRLKQFGKGTGFRIDAEIRVKLTQVEYDALQVEEILDLLICGIADTNLVCQVLKF